MPLILLLLAVAFVAKFFWLARRDGRVLARRRREAEIVARADREHAAVMAGDMLVGVYGEYPPAV